MEQEREVTGRKFQLQKVLSISFAHMIHDIYSSFLAPILPLLIDKIGFSLTMAGLLNFIQRLPSLLNPLIGIIADRSSVRYYIIAAPTVTAVSMSLIGIAPNYTIIAILLFIMGLSASFFHVPAPVLIKNVSGNRIGTGMSFYMLGGESARTLGPLVILAAISLWGLEGTWKLIPFALAASVFLLFIFRRETGYSNTRQKKKSEKSSGAVKYLKKLIPLFVALTGITFFRAMMKSALTAFLPTYLNFGGETIFYSGVALSVLQLAGAASVLAAGTISDKIGRINMLKIAAISSPVFMWLFVKLGDAFVFPTLILLGLGIFASTPVVLALLQEMGSERPAFVNSIFMTISFSASSIAVVLVGWLSDYIGLEMTFEVTSYIGLAAIPFVFYLQKIKPSG